MMRRNVIAVIALVAVAVGVGLNLLPGNFSMADDAKQPLLIHNVYFTLKDGTAENTQKLTDACFKYLKDHPGVVFFAAGPVVSELARPVNDRDFHVALCVVFKNKQAHDDYQIAKAHLQFIDENKPTWDKVRVFDNYSKP